MPIVLAFRARDASQRCALEQLNRFSLKETECSVPEDRQHVEDQVREAFGGKSPIRDFEGTVRTDIRRLCLEQCGGDGRCGNNH